MHDLVCRCDRACCCGARTSAEARRQEPGLQQSTAGRRNTRVAPRGGGSHASMPPPCAAGGWGGAVAGGGCRAAASWRGTSLGRVLKEAQPATSSFSIFTPEVSVIAAAVPFTRIFAAAGRAGTLLTITLIAALAQGAQTRFLIVFFLWRHPRGGGKAGYTVNSDVGTV